MTTPTIVQHSFGEPGSGGPITALGRVLDSPLAAKYTFVRMHQHRAAGGIDVALIATWVRLLRRVRPDLVHVRGLGNEGFHGALAARLAGCPRVLVSIHGTVRDLQQGGRSARRRLLVGAIEPATLRLATHVATVSTDASGRRFLDPYRAKLAGVIPNGVDLPLAPSPLRAPTRAALGVDDRELVCVVVGRLSLDKGHLVLAEAMRRLPEHAASTRLVVVGEGPDRAAIEAAYRGVPGWSTQLLGRRLDVAALLVAADVFVFPTLHENLSNALLEGMAAGLPVVASAVGGNVEVLERGGGLLVPPSDPAALAAALGALADDAALRTRLGREAREVVAGHYTVEHMVAGLDDLYQRILARGRPK
ncbi:glycosyltransferase [Pengzhenrongella sicca]|uniref:D-inositol 3-phosphate glycosyltransferase n=1 Tax=Pengzhenrongella sicca TaxID=2819238 RepID=A0A8A4ZDP2_9MICO|nr:glycosyltransferase [Pengzhenrongella sicca]QTE29023.1 glycosyltransferase [Pengzhenrongella sicca]